MVLDEQLLNSLTSKARANKRLRQHYDLRNSPNDDCQMMLNALEPGTIIDIHMHPYASTLTIVLKGQIKIKLYDSNAQIISEKILTANQTVGYVVQSGEWHSVECLESGTIIFEHKNGRYYPDKDSIFLNQQ